MYIECNNIMKWAKVVVHVKMWSLSMSLEASGQDTEIYDWTDPRGMTYMIELTQGGWPFHVSFQPRHWTRSHGSCPSFGSVCSLITNHYPEILESGRRNIDKQHVLLLAKEWNRPRNTAWGWNPGWGLDADCSIITSGFPVALDKVEVFSFSLGYIQRVGVQSPIWVNHTSQYLLMRQNI